MDEKKPLLLEEKIALLKQRQAHALARLNEWTERLEKDPNNVEAKRKVDIYTEVAKRLKSEIKFARKVRQTSASQEPTRKWSPVLSGSYGSGKRR